MTRHMQNMKSNSSVKAKNTFATVKRVWRYLTKSKLLLSFVLLLVAASVILSLLGPYLIGIAIDEMILNKDVAALFSLLLSLVFIYLINSLAIWLQNYVMIGIAQNTVYEMRNKLFLQIHNLPIRYFSRKQHGELMSRLTNDMENVSRTLNSSVIQVFSSFLTLLGTVSIMIYLSPLLTAITLTIIPLLFFGMKWITKRTQRYFREQQRNLGAMNGFIEETISGQSVVKIFSQEERILKQFKEKNEKLKTSGYWAQAYSGFIPKLLNVLTNFSFALIAFAGGILAIQGLVTIGMIVTFTQYSRQFTRPLNDLANQYNTVLSAVAGAERVFEIIDEDKEERIEKLAELETVTGAVSYSNVSFSYDQNGGKTIEHLSFTANVGETVAFVGPTGAGKTTVIHLLSRFYEPNEGMITIDGVDLATVTRESVRRHLAFVLQDPFLFEGSVLENIRYGRLEATEEEVIAAAKLANADSFIRKLPQGYETLLNEDGSGISQGQKQLLSIARAILARPKILILDEATSSIDTITEMKIQEALSRLMKGRTSFVIAHRLTTIEQADRIFVLNEGKLIEHGTHEQLLKRRGFYYELYHGMTENEVL